MLPSACAGKCSQSVAIRLGHCYIQFVANQVSAADCPHCPLTVCRLRCALTELDLIYCARTRTSVLVYTCIAELVVPLGKARAIARAWISWVNSNFIFSFPDGSSHQIRRCAPLPSRHTPPSALLRLCALAPTLPSRSHLTIVRLAFLTQEVRADGLPSQLHDGADLVAGDVGEAPEHEEEHVALGAKA